MIHFFSNSLKHSKIVLLISVLLTICMSFSDESKSEAAILEDVFTTNHSLNGVEVTMLIKERIDGTFLNKKTDFKISYKPYKFYLKQYYPNEGLEILYVEGEYKGKALLHRNAKTFANFKFDPLGNFIRKNNHHSIFRAGFSYFLEVVEGLYKKFDKNNTNIWQYKGLVKYAGIVCHKIVFQNNNFKYIKYKVKDGETLESISKKFLICDYLILEKNPDIKSFEDLTAGSTIFIPSDYAKQIIIYIDKTRLFPVGLKNYDDKGLFQEYTYLQYKLNPRFSPLEFSNQNPDYGFN